MAKRPSKDDILMRIQNAETFYNDYFAHLLIKREFANLVYPVKLPSSVPLFRSITPATKVAKGANQINPDLPMFDVKLPHGHSQKDEIKRDKQKIAANLLFSESEKYSKIPAFRDAAINITQYGAFCLRLLWFENLHQADEFEARVVSINPENIMPISKNEFVEFYQMRVIDVEEMVEEFNVGKPKKVAEFHRAGRTNDTLLTLKKYYTPEWRAYFIGDGAEISDAIFLDSQISLGGVQKNAMGLVPYEYGVSGWAGSSADGRLQEEARGINDLNFAAYEQESFMQSMIMAKVALDIVGHRTVIRDSGIEWPDVLWDPIVVDSHDEVNELKQRTVDDNAYRMFSLLQQQVDANTFQAGTLGLRQGDSGVQEGVLLGQDAKTWRHPRSRIEIAAESIWSKYFQLIQQFGPAYYQGKPILSKNDIVTPINIKVSLEPIDPVKKQAENLMLMQMVMNRLISWENFALRSGIIEDVTAERKLIMVNQIMQDPAIVQLMGQKAVQEWAIGENVALLKEAGATGLIPESAGALGGPSQVQAQTAGIQSDIGEGTGGINTVLQGEPATPAEAI